VRSFQETFLNKHKFKRFTWEGTEIQMYHIKGDGPSVMLLHGWDSNTARWSRMLPYLQELSLNIYAFDAAGHGYSEGNKLTVPYYTACLSEIIKEFPVDYIIGHSMGGMTAIYHQSKHQPDFIKGIITLGAPSELTTITDEYQNMLGYSNRVMKALGHLVQERFGMTIPEFSMAHFARKIRIPGLVIHDQQDTTAPLSEAKKIADFWPEADIFITDGYGHKLQHKEVFRAVVDQLKSWIQSN